MNKQVIDRIEYVTKHGTVYVKTFEYDQYGDVAKTLLKRRPQAGVEENVLGAYLSSIEYLSLKEGLKSKKILLEDFEKLFGNSKEESLVGGGYMTRYQYLPNGQLQFFEGSHVPENPKVTKKDLEFRSQEERDLDEMLDSSGESIDLGRE